MIEDFIRSLVLDGLEYFGKYYSHYVGFVVVNEDPLKLNRLSVLVPEVFTPDGDPIWALPKGVYAGKDYGVNFIPPVNAMVNVTFRLGNTRLAFWEFANFKEGELPKEFGREDLIGIKTPKGIKVFLDDSIPSFRVETQDNFFIEINADSIVLSHKEGIKIELNKGDIKAGKDSLHYLTNADELISVLKELKGVFSTYGNALVGPTKIVFKPYDEKLTSIVNKLEKIKTKYS